jgi:PAS domain S-box-containing protein
MKEPGASSLRRLARARLAARERSRGDDQLASADLREVVHELRVHQIELELQNEELQRIQDDLERSQAELVASESRYRDLFENAPVGYLRLDRSGAIVEANQTIARLLGVERSRLEDRKVSEFVVPPYQDPYYFHRQAALRGEQPPPVLVALRVQDGAMREVEIGARRLGPGEDELRVALLDVTDRERAEAERHESERQRRLMADALPLGVGYVGADGSCEFCNRTFEALCGAPQEGIEGRPIFEVLGRDAYPALRDHVRSALIGELARFEGELRLPGSGRRFVSVLLAPDRAADGRVRGFYALFDDRTELEVVRRGLRKAAAEAALAEERERRVLAADLHDGAGQLLSLASIKLRGLEDQAGPAEWAGPLHQAEQLVREARESIASLSFALSPPLLYDLGLAAAAEWLAEHLRERYGLETSIEHNGAVRELDEATRVTLFRALRELLVNVAKHAGTQRAKVAIREGADGVSVVVQDEGSGFDPKAGRSGFGLRNVLERVETLGGRVAIESAPGQGTTVTMSVLKQGGSAS